MSGATGSILVVMRPEEFTDKGVSTRFTVLLNIAVLPDLKKYFFTTLLFNQLE